MKNKVWRPKDWKPPQIAPDLPLSHLSRILSPDDIALYEAGADAMLEAILKEETVTEVPPTPP